MCDTGMVLTLLFSIVLVYDFIVISTKAWVHKVAIVD